MRRRELLFMIPAAAAAAPPQPELILLPPNGAMPNNQHLPVLLYRGAVSGPKRTERMETLFAANGWQPSWRNGVYPFHHYHSTAHEVLGFAEGEAELLLGGELPLGREITVRAGDIALLPCGTGHFRISASSDFLVVGAYALNQSADLWRTKPDSAAVSRMKSLPFPAKDPVGNALATFWKL
jgi:uncharacterized protein YjlB